MSHSNELPRSLQSSWHGFLETYQPLRADLYRYCRHLAHNPWDAEDLTQDTLPSSVFILSESLARPVRAGARCNHARLASYFARLLERPTFARVIEEAKPYWSLFPG